MRQLHRSPTIAGCQAHCFFLSSPLPSGGLELLFNRQKSHLLTLAVSPPSSSSPWTMRGLIEYLKVNLCTERTELFVAEDSVSDTHTQTYRHTCAHTCLDTRVGSDVSLYCGSHSVPRSFFSSRLRVLLQSSRHSRSDQRHRLGVGGWSRISTQGWGRTRIHIDIAWWLKHSGIGIAILCLLLKPTLHTQAATIRTVTRMFDLTHVSGYAHASTNLKCRIAISMGRFRHPTREAWPATGVARDRPSSLPSVKAVNCSVCLI